MIQQENGVFPIITFETSDGWSTVLRLAAPELDQRGLDRLLHVLDGNCRCVVVERHYIDRDYRDTFSHFHSKRFSTPKARCLRLHFFNAPVTQEGIAAEDQAMAESYLGYSVIRPTKPNCIGRTLLTHTLRIHGDAHLSVCHEFVHLLGSRLEVRGFPFISQDADATVCAQSALWMLLRYYSNRYQVYSEILPFQITSLANQHAVGSRVYPSSGLYSWQLAEALRLQRFSPVVYSRDQFQDNFEHLLYTYIESGLPLMVTVPGHVVVAHGHASDYTAAPPAGTMPWTAGDTDPFVFTSHFNRSFVISDDNRFPYEMLHQSGRALSEDSRYAWSDIEEFIVPLPEKVFLTAEQAQTAIEAVLRNPATGLDNSLGLMGRQLVFRLFLTSARAYKRSLRSRGMGHAIVETVYRNLPMPHFIWVCEVADYSSYASQREVLGEIIWDATRNAHEPDGWIACHLPERLTVDIGSAFNRHQDLRVFPLRTSSSYSLFVSNLHSL